MSKRLGDIIGCKDKTSSWHINRFPDDIIVTWGPQSNVGEKKPVILDTYIVVTKGYQGQRVCDTGSLFLSIRMYGSTGVVARTLSEEVKGRENDNFPVLVRSRECRLARQVRRSRPVSASWSFRTLKADECGAYLRDSPSYSATCT